MNKNILKVTLVIITLFCANISFAQNNIVMVKGAKEGNGDRTSLLDTCPSGEKILYEFFNAFDRKGNYYYEYDVKTKKTKLLFHNKKKKVDYSRFLYSPDCTKISFITNEEGLTNDDIAKTHDYYVMDLQSKTYQRVPILPNLIIANEGLIKTFISAFVPGSDNLLLQSSDNETFPELTDGQLGYFLYNYKTKTYSIITKYLNQSMRVNAYGKYAYYINPNSNLGNNIETAWVYADDGSVLHAFTTQTTGVVRVDRTTGLVDQIDRIKSVFSPPADRLSFSNEGTIVNLVKNSGKCSLGVYYINNPSADYSVDSFPCPDIGRLSRDGKYYTLDSQDKGFYKGDSKNTTDVFRFDLTTRILKLISAPISGKRDKHHTYELYGSYDDKVIAFESLQSNLVKGDRTAVDIFVYNENAKKKK